MEDLYNTLGVSTTASLDEIKERFRFLAQAYHPDKFSSDEHKRQAEEQFKKISAAYQVLSNSERRARYDKERTASKVNQDSKAHKQEDSISKQGPKTKQPNYSYSTPTVKTKPKANNLLVWAGVLLLTTCVFISVCFLGSSILNSTSFANVSNAVTPQETSTPIPTLYKAPTETLLPIVVKIFTDEASSPTPTATLLPFGQSLTIKGLSDTKWEIFVEKITVVSSLASPLTGRVDKAAGRFAILLLKVTNRGLSQDDFSAIGSLEIRDAEGNRYEENDIASMPAEEIYGTDNGLFINPDATEHIIAVFDISKQSTSYILKASILSTSESAGLLLDIP